jgi:GDP-4-dehydro-6-deoxy-D-mannose reductase
VGPYFVDALRRLSADKAEIIMTTKDPEEVPPFGWIRTLDIADEAAVETAIAELKPSHVLNLAGIAAPALADANPNVAWRVHVDGTLNLARGIQREQPGCWLIHVGSGMVYGESAKAGLPLDERALLTPLDEYSASKAAADLALGALARRGLKCVRLRPFNHTGPGQTEAFVVPAFAAQIARIEAGVSAPVMSVGNLEAQRDFLDVRDVAHAYALAVLHSDQLQPGSILNVASGVPRKIADVLKTLVEMSKVEISITQDNERMRPSDIPIMVGDAGRVRELLGWEPTHAFDGTLAAVLDHWRARLAQPTPH